MKKWINSLNSLWFTPMPAARLQIIRIITGVFSLWYLVSRFTLIHGLAKTNPSLYAPVGIMQLLGTPPSPWVITVLLLVTILLNIVFITGWKHRWLGPVFGLMLLFIFCYRNSWSMIYHNYNLLVLHIFILGFAPAGGWPRLTETQQRNWRFGWPLQLMSLVTLLAYFLSAVAKLKGELAWGWLNGSAMRSQVAVDAIRKNLLGVETTALFSSLYQYTWVFTIMGAASLILELLAPLVLFMNKKIQASWVVLVILMHWGIYFIMGISFYHHLSGILYLSFLAPEKWFIYATTLTEKIKNFSIKVTPRFSASTNKYIK